MPLLRSSLHPPRALGNKQIRLPRQPAQVPKSNRLPTRLLPKLPALLHPLSLHDASAPDVRENHRERAVERGTLAPTGTGEAA